MNNTWKTLSEVNVSSHVEKKGSLSYLSWAWAWSTLMEHFPDSTYSFTDPLNLENETVEVQVTVTVKEISHTMWLPVMDNRNKSVANPSSRDISDARMRCLVKCIGMHGLGLYLYAGEDLPQVAQTAIEMVVIDDKQAKKMKGLLAKHQVDVKRFLAFFKVSSVDLMLDSDWSKAVAMIQEKANRASGV